MPKFTKKYMLEDYERLYHHADLLEHYFWDTQAGMKPDAVEAYKDKNCDVRVQLWRASGAHGGYVVIKETLPNIWLLEDAIRQYQDNHSEHTLGIRICLERLILARNKIAAAESIAHTKDSDCTVDPDSLCCSVCGVDHSEECLECGGRGFHKDVCPLIKA